MTSIESIFKFDEEGFVDCIVYFYKNGKLIKKSEIPFTIDDFFVFAVTYDITNGLLTHLKNGGNLLITAPRKNKSELKLNIPKLTSSSSNGKPSAKPKTTSKPAATTVQKGLRFTNTAGISYMYDGDVSVVDGKKVPNGKGVATYDDGRRYEGEF